MPAPRVRSPLPHVLLALYVVVCLAAVIVPDPPWLTEDGIEPRILGLPFAFGWTVAWVLATFAVLVVYHAALRRGPTP